MVAGFSETFMNFPAHMNAPQENLSVCLGMPKLLLRSKLEAQSIVLVLFTL